jgi:hypothetical protein
MFLEATIDQIYDNNADFNKIEDDHKIEITEVTYGKNI